MNDTHLYLIRLGEISLKGQNRSFFEKRLRANIKAKLRGYQNTIRITKGRVFLEIEKRCPAERVETALSTTFGLVGFSKCIRAAKDEKAIRKAATLLMDQPPFSAGSGTYKVESRRSDKSFPLTSYELNVALAEEVHRAHPNLQVDVQKPEMILYCEVRDHAYLYTTPQVGLGGLPVNTAGKGMLLLSGGIDSPVAGFKMAQRGLRMECIYFHAYPYTSQEALDKVLKLAAKISPFLQGTRVHVVPFTEAQLHIKANAPSDETTLMFRAAMMELSNILAEQEQALCVVTGEALSQVASQTVEGLAFSDSYSELLVLRPLVGLDKQEIINIARDIDTYETSILPYEDCCTIFSPKHPLTRPDKARTRSHYQALEMKPFIEAAIAAIETYDFNALGEIIRQE
ncbi:MAG TPA: tRNA uracil 4-sulfurtransferase ThiI [Sphaerochaeta sp.]|nr:tRNA uracil 4-sulfurtransferase ThiI [Sphaerochaeta sp.]